MAVKIRKAVEKDLIQVYRLIEELAIYEKAPGEVSLTPEKLKEDFRNGEPRLRILIAEENNTISGMAFYFYTYSTWKGKCLYLEDIIVSENHRRKGIGTALFEELLREAKDNEVKRFAWQVLEWNEPAISFYKKYNADLDPEWINCRLTAEQIQNLPLD